jgi:hypothetical protein
VGQSSACGSADRTNGASDIRQEALITRNVPLSHTVWGKHLLNF